MSTNVKMVSGEIGRHFPFGTSPNALPQTTSNATSGPIFKEGPFSTYQAFVTGTGAVTATVAIQATNDENSVSPSGGSPVANNWVALGTITLSGTNQASDGFTTSASWRFVRAVVTNLTGTGAVCTVLQGN
jgi:hypothetical protein